MKFNIIGFSNTVNKENKHCVIHAGTRLIQSTKEPDLLFCPQCGTEYSPKDSNTEEKIQSKFGPNSNQSRIVQPKKQKKYYDQSGNEITDEQLLKDIAAGAHVISYHEYKPQK